MRRYAIPLVTMAICAVAVPVIAASESDASGQHLRKHHQRTHLGLNNSWRHASAAEEVHTAAAPYRGGGEVCPGGRSFDCKIWPPPIGDDPDRRATDGGP
jgi:hypothetical protein